MASNYPGSLDSFDTIASDKKTSDSVGGRTHRQMHNDLGDAIEAVQTELGTTPSGSYDTVKARFEAIEGSTLPQVDAKGDLIVGTADNTYDNLGVGTNDTVLLAASGETKGVKWAQVPTAAIQDSAVTAAKLAVQPGNLLTENQASGTDTLAATTGFDTGGSGAVLATTTAQARQGSRSLQVTASGGGNGTFFTGLAGAAAGAVPVTAGATYTAAVSLRSAAATASYGVNIAWLDSGGGHISSSASTPGTTSTSAWTDATVTAVAPASAAYAAVGVSMTAAASSVHYADCFSLHRGAGGTWQLPGVPIPGQGAIKANGAVELPGGDYSPEWTVMANPGSTFLQTSGAATVTGMLSWRKATGTGYTGWVAEGALADTGWRDVSSLLVNGWTGNFYLRRVGDHVTLRFLSTGSGGSGSVLTFPAGFRIGSKANDANLVLKSAPADDTDGGGYYKVSDNTFNIFNWTAYAGYVEFPFTSYGDPWPSSLPGSAA